jgi:hypothetical protein
MDDHAPTQPLFLPTPARLPGQVRRLGRFLALGTAGLVALLAGLAWDAVLHARGPGLAAREGVSTPSNPGHLLAGAGVALVAAGLLGALATLATVRRRAPLPAGARAGLGVLAAVLVLGAGVTGAWAAAGHGHDGGGAAHAHGQPGQAVAASSGPDGRADHAGAHAIANLPDVAAASDAERARAQALLDASVAATRRYRDPEAARAAGYRFALGGKGRLLHAPNPAYRDDGRLLDPDRPEALVYWRGPRGGLALVGVMFTAPQDTPGPDVGGPITRWHDHETCRDPATGAKAGRPAQGACPAGRVLHRSGELLHVWFTGDLATAFALRPPAAALASSPAVAAPSA